MNIRWSRYNFFFNSQKHGYLLYNSLSGKIISISKDIVTNCFKDKKPLLEEISKYPLFYIRLRSMFALTVGEEEEKKLQDIRLKRRLRQCRNHGLSLTVAPTMDCNFACSYCYVKCQNSGKMNKATQNALADYISQWPGTREYCDINWFGGEPLLAFECIKSITEKLIELGIPLQAALTTNGYLLSDDIVAELDNLKITSIHITLDGSQENHDKHRPLISGKGSYDVILTNIDNLMSKWEKKCSVRVNLTSENYMEYVKYYENLRAVFPQKNLFIYPGIIDDPHKSKLKFTPNHKAVSDMILYMYRTYGTNPRQYFSLSDDTNYCSVLQPNNITISPEGNIYKCWRDLGYPEMRIGALSGDTLYSDSECETVAQYMIGSDPFDDPECRKCILLPACGGGCPQQRVRVKYFGEKIDSCPYYKYNLPKYLEVYYEKSGYV